MGNIFSTTIRVPKQESAYTYFMLESHEGLCFYSTLESSLKQGFRDIQITGSRDFWPDIEHLIKQLERQYPIQTLVNDTGRQSESAL